ncbi:MAG TPA: hypothetical protein VE398_20560 [Acidobacteriota bacterium]|nr:hypothetical protein [Acidobacteriota bacterium]
MKHKWVVCVLLLAMALLGAGFPFASYKVETTGACTNADISDGIRIILQDQGLRVVGDSGPLCEVWIRKVLPQSAASGTDYNTLAPGTFVGVIQYLGKGTDYRGQTVKPGIYTMRYQTMPSDGNHMGVAPTSDFFVLLPPSSDKDPDAVLEYQDIIKLGKQASGIAHIYPLNLTSPSGSGNASMRSVDDSHWALEAKTKAQSKGGAEIDFPIAVILVGKAEA